MMLLSIQANNNLAPIWAMSQSRVSVNEDDSSHEIFFYRQSDDEWYHVELANISDLYGELKNRTNITVERFLIDMEWFTMQTQVLNSNIRKNHFDIITLMVWPHIIMNPKDPNKYLAKCVSLSVWVFACVMVHTINKICSYQRHIVENYGMNRNE